MVKIVAVRIRLPLFSVTHPEAFQVMLSLPLPQPATLVGALGYALGVYQDKGTRAYEELQTLVEEGKLVAARARIADVNGRLGILTPSSVVLRRFRVADKAHETKKKGERKAIELLRDAIASGDYATAKHVVEVTLTDAFYREYVMGTELLAVWVFDSAEIEESVFWHINRLGDTESLCTVVNVQQFKGQIVKKKEVDTPFPAPLTEGSRVVRGTYMPVKINDEKRQLKPFAIPILATMEAKGRLRYRVYRPTLVRIAYERDVDVCETPWGDIVVG